MREREREYKHVAEYVCLREEVYSGRVHLRSDSGLRSWKKVYFFICGHFLRVGVGEPRDLSTCSWLPVDAASLQV